MKNKPELLAPAGNVESFYAAVENGADAVYLGLKKFNARATADNFTLEELSSLISFAHRRGVRIYVALNSVVAATEMAEIVDTLDCLSGLNPDALIVQDGGIFNLVRRYFPRLKLHASTLAAVHNRAGVNALARMGAERIVLARELSLAEIEKICSATSAEVEIFIHGALCYSYSGLCLTSSFRGGHSGLRGQCVQPCRLKFRQGRKEGFFLSCNDYCALALIPRLKRLRIAAFKIEGRMKPAGYIANVVRAYRGILDAASEDEEQSALAVARELLAQSPSRHPTSGHLEEERVREVLSPHRSGSSGIWCATVKAVKSGRALLDLRCTVARGDRLRPESSSGREEEAFTVSELLDMESKPAQSMPGGSRAFLVCSKTLSAGDRLIKIGAKSESASLIWKKIREKVGTANRVKPRLQARQKILKEIEGTACAPSREQELLIIKAGTPDDLVKALQSPAAMALIYGGRANLERIAKQRFSPVQMRKLGISLPAILSEKKDIEYYAAAIKWFIEKGFRLWEINNWGHLDLLGKSEQLRIIAGARLNLRNGAALAETASLGCRWSVLSVEATREELVELAQSRCSTNSVVCVYSWPPLFTSRLIPDLDENKPFLSPRKDTYIFTKQGGCAHIFADRPISWLDQLPFLRSLGFRKFLIDTSEGPGKQSIEPVLRGFAASRSPSHYSDFNFERRP